MRCVGVAEAQGLGRCGLQSIFLASICAGRGDSWFRNPIDGVNISAKIVVSDLANIYKTFAASVLEFGDIFPVDVLSVSYMPSPKICTGWIDRINKRIVT